MSLLLWRLSLCWGSVVEETRSKERHCLIALFYLGVGFLHVVRGVLMYAGDEGCVSLLKTRNGTQGARGGGTWWDGRDEVRRTGTDMVVARATATSRQCLGREM